LGAVITGEENVEVMDTDSVLKDTQENFCLENFKKMLSDKILDVILLFRSRQNVPYSATVEFVSYMKSFTDVLVGELRSLLRDSLSDNITSALNSISTIFSSFRSEHCIRKLYEDHPQFISPQSLPLGARIENEMTSQGVIKTISRPNVAQYIPISKTLKSLLLNDPLFLSMIIESYNQQRESGIYRKFQDGSKYKSLRFQWDGKNILVFIQLYADGMGLTNPLASAATEHNSTMFYFLVNNLDPKFYGSLSNIHLVAMCNSADLKYDEGLNILLEAIVDDLLRLETDGFEINIPSRGTFQVKAVLSQFTGDNLALNQIFGLTESFAHDYFCPLCYCTREESQKYFKEKHFRCRTPESYKLDVETLLLLREDGQLHIREVKKFCILNRLKFFNIMDNWINDCMHTCLQGIIPYVCGLVLKTLISQKILDIDQINDEISKKFSRLKIDKKNKPGLIKNNGKEGLSFKMSAAQLWAFLRYFPLSFANRIPVDNQYWHLIISLSEIIDIVMAPKLSESMLCYFEVIYASFLLQFKRLYPAASLRPKMHFLVHLPTIVRKNGPMRTFWTMNFERLNGKIKAPSHIINSFRNPQLTLVFRRQCATFNKTLCLKDSVCVNSTIESYISDFLNVDMISSFFDSSAEEIVSLTDSIKINGVNYIVGLFVIVEKSDQGFNFGKI
jgi:hypothetical protein